MGGTRQTTHRRAHKRCLYRPVRAGRVRWRERGRTSAMLLLRRRQRRRDVARRPVVAIGHLKMFALMARYLRIGASTFRPGCKRRTLALTGVSAATAPIRMFPVANCLMAAQFSGSVLKVHVYYRAAASNPGTDEIPFHDNVRSYSRRGSA